MIKDRLKQLMSDTNAAIEPHGFTLTNPNLGRSVWALYYYDPETKHCFTVLRRRGVNEALCRLTSRTWSKDLNQDTSRHNT